MEAHSQTRARNWCFTYNNPPEGVLSFTSAMNYLHYQKEVGASGTEHWQGYVQMKASTKLGGMKKIWGDRVSFRVARGTPEQNIHYCSKPVFGCQCKHCVPPQPRIEGPYHHGTVSIQGKRPCLEEVGDQLRKRPLADVASEHPEAAIRYSRGMRFFREEVVLPSLRGNEPRRPQVIVYWGDSGAGKSSRARLHDPHAYEVPEKESNVMWFPLYDGQKTIIMHEKPTMKYQQLLRLLDWYPMQVQTKGGFVTLNHELIIICANEPPETWYSPEVQGTAEALLRRLYEFGNVIHVYFGPNGEELDEEYPRHPVPPPTQGLIRDYP